MTNESKTPAESAAIIRKALKEKGWSSKQISVRSDSYSMGSSVDVVIKAPGISRKVVEKIAMTQDDVRRDQNGDILSGGNRYVTVRFDHDLLAARALKFRPIIDGVPLSDSSSTKVIAAGREFYILHPEHWRVTLVEHGEGGETFHCMGEDVAACRLAEIDLEAGTDLPAKPRDYEAEAAVYACPGNARRTTYGPTGRAHHLGEVTISEVNPEPCYRASQLSKNTEPDCSCSRCTDRAKAPADLRYHYAITTLSGLYLGEERASSPLEARTSYADRAPGYYQADGLTACRIKLRKESKP